MTDPQSNDPVASDNPENPGGDLTRPDAGELREVGDDEANTHADNLGDETAQRDDHPYDRDADPDSDPKTGDSSGGSSSGGSSSGGSGTDAVLGSAAPHPVEGKLSTEAGEKWLPSDPGASGR